MRKLTLMLLLSIVSGNAMAWVEEALENLHWVGVSSNDTSSEYSNPATIRKNGEMVKMWSLRDYKAAQVIREGKVLSMKAQNEYDCKEEQYRGLAYSMYSGNMGTGLVVYFNNNDSDSWAPVTPGSVVEVLWKAACGK